MKRKQWWIAEHELGGAVIAYTHPVLGEPGWNIYRVVPASEKKIREKEKKETS